MTDDLLAENAALKALLRPATVFDPAWCLSRQETTTLASLLAGRGGYAQLVFALDVPLNGVYEIVFRLRRKLRRQGIEIKCNRGISYALPQADRVKVMAGVVSATSVENRERISA